MKSLKVARISGIDIEIHWSWILIFAYFVWRLSREMLPQAVPDKAPILYWLYGMSIALIFFLSILFHELSHAVVAKKFSVPVKRIILFVFGGVAQIDILKVAKARTELAIALAGPLASLAAAAFFWTIIISIWEITSQLTLISLWWLSVMNIALAILNIIPIFPMDGGRIFRAVCWWKINNLAKATKIAVDTAVFLCIIALVAAFYWLGLLTGLWIGLILSFLVFSGMREYDLILSEKRGGEK